MTVCENCKNKIDDTYDDNYDHTGSKIKCPECGHWQYVEYSETKMDNKCVTPS